jgi:hypothetical protein
VSIGIELMFAQNGGYFARAREAFASSVTVAHAPIATTTGSSACIFIHRGPARKYALMPLGVRRDLTRSPPELDWRYSMVQDSRLVIKADPDPFRGDND